MVAAMARFYHGQNGWMPAGAVGRERPVAPRLVLPPVIAHADWSLDPAKRLVAVARLVAGGGQPRYRVVSLAPAPAGPPGAGDLLDALLADAAGGAALVGFDFPIGLPRAYAAAVGAGFFPEFLARLGSPPWQEFERVAERPGEISLFRPFYPQRPGGTSRAHLTAGLGLAAGQLRRRCDGRDAETLFWTLGGKQAGKAALDGWRLLRQARGRGLRIALWPFEGQLSGLLAGTAQVVVAETYPREFYRCIGAPPRARWSKRRRDDRLLCVPALLAWADSLHVSWQAGIRARIAAGLSAGRSGEDEFDAVVGMLGMISVVTGALPDGAPAGDPAVRATEGWIVGRVG
jgi:hypothetical protein